ncbi:MAG: cell division protein ZipA [Dokdonella sp.]|uniref:cell division protein ZipA n=1 Tax=Dokdonella sp. TaxID=2291710 RepID=UPI0025C4B40C|nr:cell division protein ZipA [Dokdonella sp.]MBZ0223339.1 cell division protein ZipA [Dokdonella sp.]MCC7254522.1 cell division protein ZipA [Dokdonella sp.]
MGWNAAVGVPLLLAGLVVLALIYWFGRPQRPGQGERRQQPPRERDATRIEPTLGEGFDEQGNATPEQGELDVSLGETGVAEPVGRSAPPRSSVGARPQQSIERIVTLYVAARAGDQLNGADIVVAAEKAGLQFGDMGIFHRLVLGKKADGPVFSMANMVKPGTFDMARLDAVATPGISLFMTLPGPLPALDAWEMMLPTAQRLAELLGAQVLDEDRNALGRQRIAHVRDELRAWDREQERMQIRPGR